jgi:dihydrofolate reductase
LAAVSSARTRIERRFEPEGVARMKATSSRDISVSGPELAAQAIAAGLVDDYRLFLVPFIVGGGKRALPEGVFAGLELVDEHRFAGGTVHLRYRPREGR